MEVDKKDELIRQVTKITANTPVIQNFRTHDTQVCSHEKLEEIRIKVEKLQHTIAENKDIIHEKNITISELKTEYDAIRLENVDHLKRIEELENLLVEKSHKLHTCEQSESQRDLVVQSLQEDLKIKTTKLLDLRYQYKMLEEKYESKIQAEKTSQEELGKYFTDLANLLECEAKPQSCILKLTDILRSLSDSKEQVKRQGDSIEAYEFEQRASRETISRLSGEINKEQELRQAAENSEREIKQEFEKIKTAYQRSESCIHLLEERVNSLTQSLQAARDDAMEREKQLNKINEIEAMFQTKINNHNASEQSTIMDLEKCRWNSDDLKEIQKFIDAMVSWLSFPHPDQLSSLFNTISQRIEEMEESLRQHTQVCTDIELELNDLREERSNYNSNFDMLKERIAYLEEQRASDGTLIDELRNERDRLYCHLCKLAQILKIDEPVAEFDAEMLGDTLALRLTQLQQGDTEKQTNQRLQISRLQRELRETKDRADSLDLQIGVMRRRLIDAQENRHQTVMPASGTPMTLATSEKERRKLLKQLENVKELENNLRQEVVMLKARLLESSQSKLAQMSVSKALRAAQNKIDELGSICENRDNEVKKLTTELNESKKHSNIEIENQNEELQKLRKEIKHLQTSLNSSQKSEEHLLEFRKLVAIYLGLDNEQLTIPDYEILTHLDRLVSANQSQVANAVATERAIDLVTGNTRSNILNHYGR
ncbi:hypothetical protein MS3_00006804 [Schistosoma haematobium]|nr:hypothetical protein MS3_00006804 [Schistosoma haematobium]KAH9585601.1 hypothetical protein MS3_00006804 [Schistosoma haematobium]